MAYDFDTLLDRVPSGSLKWGGCVRSSPDEDVLPLWVADMDFPSPPEVVEAIRRRAEHPIYGYPVRTDGYYDSLIAWMRRRNGWEIQRDWICFSPGVVPALNIAVLAYTQPGDKVVVQTPVYYPFSSAVLSNGRQLVENSLKLEGGRYAMDLEDLERRLDSRTKLLVLCSPHNPVGRVWERGELERLVELCARKGVVIVSDEIHSDLILGGRKHVCTAALSPEAARMTVTLGAPNKTFNIAGLGIANAIIPDRRLREAFMNQAANLGLGIANVFGIVAQEAAYSKGEAWLEELLSYLRGNYGRLVSFLAERLPSLSVLPLEGTYLAWIDCRRLGMSDAELKAFFLKEAKLWLDEGTMFGSGGSGFMRINLACPRSLLDEALSRLEKALAKRG